MESLIVLFILLVLIALPAGFVMLKNILYICEPNELLIRAGNRRRIKALPGPASNQDGSGNDSRIIGYDYFRGGRAIRIPLFHEMYRMDLTNMIIELSVTDAYSKGGIPLNVKGIANVKVSSKEELLSQAVERFLGLPREYIIRVAKETLEGNLRGVLSQMTPEEVNEDKTTFGQNLQDEAEEDLARLGLELDTLKIQNVSDNVRYLDSLGRKSGADLQRRARIAEAEAKASARIKDAGNRRETFDRQVDAELQIARAEAARQVADWQTQAHALAAESKATVEAKVARAQADIDVEKARIEQLKAKLQAEVIEPARARKARLEQEARAAASKQVQDGRASAAALQQVSTVWEKLGDDASKVFLLQNLDLLVDTMLRPLGNMRVDRMTVLPSTSGSRGDGATGIGGKAMAAREELLATLGIDIAKIMQNLEANDA
jgi:flotillin